MFDRLRISSGSAAVLFTISFIAIVSLVFLLVFKENKEPDIIFGTTFSTVYSKKLGLNWQENYLAALDDLKIRNYRIPLYWSEIESEQDNFDWSEIDWIVKQAELRDAKLTLVIGSKVPRWPECFVPDWAESLETNHQKEEVRQLITAAIIRYRNSPSVIRWQVENEAFFPFGICPAPDIQHLREELITVRQLDNKPIQLTVSGELESWFDVAIPADILGISIYRLTWNNLIGYFRYPLPPVFYRIRALVVSPFVDKVIISELQAEPWFNQAIDSKTPLEWYATFNQEALHDNIEFAEKTGLDEAYFWGVEWWYFLKQHHIDGLWEEARGVF